MTNCSYEYNFHDSCSRKAGDTLPVKSQHLIPTASQMTLQMLDLKREDRHVIKTRPALFRDMACDSCSDRDSSITVRYSWMFLLLQIYREFNSLQCTWCQPIKKNLFKSFWGTTWFCAKSTRVINVCMIIEYWADVNTQSLYLILSWKYGLESVPAGNQDKR